MQVIPKFRPFCQDDLAEFEQMVIALYQEDPPGEEMSLQKIRLTVKELLSHPEKGDITMFCVSDAVVGYAIVIYYWSNEYGGNIAIIDEFYIKPSWRGKEIGSSFLNHVASEKACILKGIQVEVTPANPKAFIFYSRNGFSPMKNRHLFLKL
jgi:GNAT superfamily N-acetyltransferase